MFVSRPLNLLGHCYHVWLDERQELGFDRYHDPARMGWGRIRAWKANRTAAQSGFMQHTHRDTQIITSVRASAITHKDFISNQGRTGAGDVLVMSAGTGVVPSEFNLEDEESTLLQIWVETDQRCAQPGWGAMPFPKNQRDGQFQLLASGNPDDGALTIHADARVLGATVK